VSTLLKIQDETLSRATLEKRLHHATSAPQLVGHLADPIAAAQSVTAETIPDDELRALRDEAIAAGDDGTRNIACGALNAVDEFQGFACRHACAAVLNAKRSGRP
jgi:hypothetical protein